MDSEFCCRHGGDVERIERPSLCGYQYAKNICTGDCGNIYSAFIKSYPWPDTVFYSSFCTKEVDGSTCRFSPHGFVRKNNWYRRYGWHWFRNSKALTLWI